MIYSKGEPLKKVPTEQLVDELFAEIDRYYAAGRTVVRDEVKAAEARAWLAEHEDDTQLTPERARQPVPAPPVDEYAQALAAERRDPLARQRLAPSAEQIAQSEPHALADQDDAGGGEGDERAEATRAHHLAILQRARRPRPDPRRHDHHLVLREDLDVNRVATAKGGLTIAENGTAHAGLEARPDADGARFAQKRSRNRLRASATGRQRGARQRNRREGGPTGPSRPAATGPAPLAHQLTCFGAILRRAARRLDGRRSAPTRLRSRGRGRSRRA
jgi:hypothetical protein